MKKIHLFLLSLLSGLLLTFGWPAGGFPLILFIAFIPLLIVENYLFKSNSKKRYVFINAYIGFLTWNILTTWWIVNSTLVGAILAISLNTLFMAIVFTLFHITRKAIGNITGFISLIAYWMSYEYLILNWELTWSWLNLGNGFANYPQFIQWYEYTGIFGGTLWILVINILLFAVSKSKIVTRKSKILLFLSVLIIIIPILVSLGIYWNYKEKGDNINVVVVQPNIDPYNEKFGGLSLEKQLSKMLMLSDKHSDYETDLVVCPETAISEDVCENKLNEEPSIITLKNYLYKNPGFNIIIGMSSFREYSENHRKSPTARKFTLGEGWYDVYNTAIFMDSSSNIQIYHKSKLVPGVERIPYPNIFKPFEKFAINLGGASGSLGTQDDRTPFKAQTSNFKLPASNFYKLAPAICYESIFGEFMGKYVKNGANLICIITNDGWWGNTPGYKQHFQYARLRAIETRRSIARSANTGISGFINQRGDVLVSTLWWQPLAIKQTLSLNKNITFYVRFGDYIGKLGVILSFVIFIFTIIKSLYKRFS